MATLFRVIGLMGALPCVSKQVQILGDPLSCPCCPFCRLGKLSARKGDGGATLGKEGMAAVP